MNRTLSFAAAAGVVLIALAAAVLLFLRTPKSSSDGSARRAASDSRPSAEPSSPPRSSPPGVAPLPRGSTSRPATRAPIDRQQRDDVREKIYAAFGQLPPERRAAGSPPTPALGRLSAEYIRDRVRSDFAPLAKQCYETALERDPKLGGKLVLHFVIVGDDKVGGIVESVDLRDDSTLVDPELVECMRQSMLGMVFEPPENGGIVTVTYPFLLSPDEPDGGATR